MTDSWRDEQWKMAAKKDAPEMAAAEKLAKKYITLIKKSIKQAFKGPPVEGANHVTYYWGFKDYDLLASTFEKALLALPGVKKVSTQHSGGAPTTQYVDDDGVKIAVTRGNRSTADKSFIQVRVEFASSKG